MASALSPSGSGIPCWDFHHPQSKPLLPGGFREEIHSGRGGAWMGSRNVGLVIHPLSQASRVTGPPTEIFN